MARLPGVEDAQPESLVLRQLAKVCRGKPAPWSSRVASRPRHPLSFSVSRCSGESCPSLGLARQGSKRAAESSAHPRWSASPLRLRIASRLRSCQIRAATPTAFTMLIEACNRFCPCCRRFTLPVGCDTALRDGSSTRNTSFARVDNDLLDQDVNSFRFLSSGNSSSKSYHTACTYSARPRNASSVGHVASDRVAISSATRSSSKETSRNAWFQRRSNSPATRRLSGSTLSYCRWVNCAHRRRLQVGLECSHYLIAATRERVAAIMAASTLAGSTTRTPGSTRNPDQLTTEVMHVGSPVSRSPRQHMYRGALAARPVAHDEFPPTPRQRSSPANKAEPSFAAQGSAGSCPS